MFTACGQDLPAGREGAGQRLYPASLEIDVRESDYILDDCAPLLPDNDAYYAMSRVECLVPGEGGFEEAALYYRGRAERAGFADAGWEAANATVFPYCREGETLLIAGLPPREGRDDLAILFYHDPEECRYGQ